MTENIYILKFAEAKQPIFKEKKGEKGGYIEFGEDNKYPGYLLSLYNNSAKNNAIIKGKVNYITGNGWQAKEADPIAEQFIKAPNEFESLADLTRKVSTDIEVFGGAYLEIIWSAVGGQLVSVNHIDYTKIRSNKDNTQFWYKNDWADRKEDAVVIAAFSSKIRQGKQILYVKEYRPGLETYALPGYMGSLNYIESDIEVSKHVLGNAQTGFSASKMITLPNGEPTPDEKRVITKKFEDRFTGSDGKKFILSFVSDAARKPIVEDLGASDITKEDFSRVDAIIQQNLFAGHQIVSPMLFGIKTEGQLGGATELKTAYEIFKSTYANDKQRHLESVFNTLARIKGATQDITIIPVEPINVELSENALLQIAPKEWLLEKAGIDPTKYGIVSDPAAAPNPAQAQGVNENLKNLTGRQYQQLMRVIRQFSQGKITKEMATTMLKGGLGLTDADVNAMLGVDADSTTEDVAFAAVDTEETLKLWDEYGEAKDGYTVLQSMEVQFGMDDPSLLKFEVDLPDATQKEKQLIEIIKKDPLIPAEDIAKVLLIPVEQVLLLLNLLINQGIMNIDPETGRKKLNVPVDKIIDAPPATTIVVRYSYEWKPQFAVSDANKATTPLIDRSRPFCKKLLRLDRFYTRREIQAISARLGYDVFTRGGGWWGDSPSCRHRWVANRVIQKKKS